MTIRVGDGEVPVLLIHASGSGARQMEKVARLLLAEEPALQIWIPGLSGYQGVAATPAADPISQHLSILKGVIAEIARPCFIVGHSMGGFLGLKLAASVSVSDNAARILGVVAVEPMAFGMLAQAEDHAVRQEDRDVLARMQALISSGAVESGISCFVEYWNQTTWAKIPAAVRDQLMGMADQIGAEAAAVSLDSTTSYQISAPVHLMYGENSPRPAQRMVHRLAETLESATVESIPAAGHMSLMRNPEKFTSGIIALIRRRSVNHQPV